MPAGFAPVFDGNSKVLILGSFPSVRSREVGFYYGNPQNRFWRMLSAVFKAPIGRDTESKVRFVLSHRIALWDIAVSCEIDGSKDESMRELVTADIPALLKKAPISVVLCNGSRSYIETVGQFPDLGVPILKMPSTSPRNRFYDQSVWEKELSILL